MRIGSELTVSGARNPQLDGITGTIIDETAHTYTIRTAHTTKTLIKNQLEETP